MFASLMGMDWYLAFISISLIIDQLVGHLSTFADLMDFLFCEMPIAHFFLDLSF